MLIKRLKHGLKRAIFELIKRIKGHANRDKKKGGTHTAPPLTTPLKSTD